MTTNTKLPLVVPVSSCNTPFYSDAVRWLRDTELISDVTLAEKKITPKHFIFLYSKNLEEPRVEISFSQLFDKEANFFLCVFDIPEADQPVNEETEYKTLKQRFGNFLPPPSRVIFLVEMLDKAQHKKLLDYIVATNVSSSR